MTFVVLIPARLASTRLPNKPLADIGGLPMVVRTARQAALSGASRVVVAADDATIAAACAAHGVEALLTRTDHASGSDRLAEACERLGLDGPDVVVNVQGDEPLIEPSLVAACAALLLRDDDCAMATAAHPIDSTAELNDPNVVKLVCNAAGRAQYFSRAPIPYWRDAAASRHANPLHSPDDGRRTAMPLLPDGAIALRHIGLYAYRAAFLRRFKTLAPSPLESIESLEQLRVLWHGEQIAVHVQHGPAGIGVDTPEDLRRVRLQVASDPG